METKRRLEKARWLFRISQIACGNATDKHAKREPEREGEIASEQRRERRGGFLSARRSLSSTPADGVRVGSKGRGGMSCSGSGDGILRRERASGRGEDSRRGGRQLRIRLLE